MSPWSVEEKGRRKTKKGAAWLFGKLLISNSKTSFPTAQFQQPLFEMPQNGAQGLMATAFYMYTLMGNVREV